MLVVHVVVSADDDSVQEHGVYRDRAIADARARCLGHGFGTVEVAINAFHDQQSVWSAYEYDRLLDVHRWAGLRPTPEAAKIVAGPSGHIIERKLEA